MRRLLIRPGAIGDCIVALPVMEFLKADYTEIWVPSTVVPLVQFADTVRSIASTGIDTCGIGDSDLNASLRERLSEFDEVVSWYGANRPEFRAAVSQTGPRWIFHRALPLGDTMHATDFLAAQVGAPPGLQPRIRLPSRELRGTLVIHPFSGSTRKNWPLAKYRQLAARLPRPVEWTAGPEEVLEDAHRFENLLDLASWLTGAHVYVGNDSGITHLAAAVGVPTIALFGPTAPDAWCPRGQHVREIQRNPIDHIEVDEVKWAIDDLCSVPNKTSL